MVKKLFKLRFLLLNVVLAVYIFTACTMSTPQKGADKSQEIPTVKREVQSVDLASDSSELPDWTGETLKLRVWNAHGTGDAARVDSDNDVVSPEIKRIFGIEFDRENSFDNGGNDTNAKLSVLAASEDWPEIMINGDIDKLVSEDKLYELNAYLPKYAPHIWKVMQGKTPKTTRNGYKFTGKIYRIPLAFNADTDTMLRFYPYIDVKKYGYVSAPLDYQGYFSNLWVRDDILKLAYPNAKTQNEIEESYLRNGGFMRDELYDVPIRSFEDAENFFRNIARAIKDHNIKENNKPVYATYVYSGQDNYARSSFLLGMMRGLPNWNYFTYFDGESKRIEIGYKQGWFKKDMLMFNEWVREGIAPRECLIDNNEIFAAKRDNGEYAIVYAWDRPDENKLSQAKKPYRYRKVYFNIPQNTKKMLFPSAEPVPANNIAIFKDGIKESQLEQVLRCFDFMATDVGAKLMAWGPRTAGLWEEKNGKRVFIDKAVEDNIVYGVENNACRKYNLCGPTAEYETPAAWPKAIAPLIKFGGIQNPRYTYDRNPARRSSLDANTFFSSGIFDQAARLEDTVSIEPSLWNFTALVPDAQKFWEVRGTGFESLMTRTLAAEDNQAFEAAFAEMIAFAERNGLTEETRIQINKIYQEKYSEDYKIYMDSFKK